MSGGISNYLQLKLLDHVLGATAYSAPANVYAALYSVVPTGAGGGTEVSGGAYARVTIVNNTTNWPNASGGSPGLKSNGTIVTFPTPTIDWAGGANMVAMGLFDALTVGNLLAWGELLYTYTDVVPDASTDVFNATSHPFVNGDGVRVRSTGTIPGGFSSATKYYVVNSAASTFKLSATQGGSAIDVTSVGDGRIQVAKDAFRQALVGDTVSFAVSTVTLQLTGT